MNEIQKTGAIDVEKIKVYLESMNLTSNLNKSEVQQFIEIASAFGLNPFKREIYASKYGSNFSIIVGYEVYIKRAERTERLSGWHVTTEGTNDPDPKKNTLKAIITINRKDFQHPFIHEVLFNEYAQRTKEGQLNKFWREKPITMIKKVAIAQGFRLCFSDELGGLPYTKEELDTEEGTGTVIESKPTKQKEPAKPQQAAKDKKLIADEIEKAESNQDLVKIWNENKDQHENKKFSDLIAKRRDQLIQEGKIQDKKKAESVEVKKDAPKPEVLSIEKMKAVIDKQTNEDDILMIIQDENRREILTFAKEKIDKLNQ